MGKDEFQARTRVYALRIIRLVRALPRDMAGDVIGRQLLRSATSVGANYRAACQAGSSADFVAKLKIVEEEADESLYWLDLLVASDLVAQGKLSDLMKEGNELLAMTVASITTVRKRFSSQSSIVNRQSSME